MDEDEVDEPQLTVHPAGTPAGDMRRFGWPPRYPEEYNGPRAWGPAEEADIYNEFKSRITPKIIDVKKEEHVKVEPNLNPSSSITLTLTPSLTLTLPLTLTLTLPLTLTLLF